MNQDGADSPGVNGEPTDEALVARAQEGEETAFRLLVERRTPVLRARVRRRLPRLVRRKLGESDVLQAAYLAAFQRLADFEDRGEGSFARWFDQILEFKIKKALRQYRDTAKRSVGREISRDQRASTVNVRARGSTPSGHAIAGELQDKVRDAMAELPDDYRQVLRLVKEQGRSLAEAGRCMKRTEKAAAKLYGRAVHRLTRLVFGKEEEEP